MPVFMTKLIKKFIGCWLKIQRKTHLDRYYNHLIKRWRFTGVVYVTLWCLKAWNISTLLSYFYSQQSNMILNTCSPVGELELMERTVQTWTLENRMFHSKPCMSTLCHPCSVGPEGWCACMSNQAVSTGGWLCWGGCVERE